LIKGIIFDLGDTLIEFAGDRDAVSQAGAEAMARWYFTKKHIKLDAVALVNTFMAERAAASKIAEESQTEVLAEDTLRLTLAKIAAPPSTGPLTTAAIKIFFGPEEEAYQSFPEAVDTLKILKQQGLRLGLYSNATDDLLVQRLVNRNGLRPWLSPTFSSAGWGWRKPRPEPFDLIATRWRLPADEIVVVGDTPQADILGAQSAGMHSILVWRHESAFDAGRHRIQPTMITDSLSELPEIISQL
jgi:HAD superfamily hydrolase (TIGR01549 family)